MIYPSGRVVHYGYNSLGQIDQVSTQENASAPLQAIVQDVGYLPFGPLQSLTYGNGQIRILEYDQDYQLAAIQSDVLNRTYSYDPAGNIETISDLLAPTRHQSFQYDPLARLTQASGSYGTLSYGYDEVGNRLSRSQQQDTQAFSETYAYAADSNRLLQVDSDTDGTRALSYSEAGHLTLDQGAQQALALTYNQQNRLQEVSRDGQSLAVYVHNALGQRVIKVATDPTANLHFHYDRNGLLIAESTPTGEVRREILYLNNVPVAVLMSDSQETVVELEGINFQDYSIDAYDPSQDVSSTEGEVHGIGFDEDTSIHQNSTFQLDGTQNWGRQNFHNYSGDGSPRHYVIPVGQYYQGAMQYLLFAMDHDVASSTAESVFGQVNVYEAGQP